MQINAPSDAIVDPPEPSLIAEAWSADTEAACGQIQVHGLEFVALPGRFAWGLARSALRWSTHTPALHLWGWLRGGEETHAPSQAPPAVYPLSFEHMQFLANNFDELKTQQRLALADLQERLSRLEQQLERLQPQPPRPAEGSTIEQDAENDCC